MFEPAAASSRHGRVAGRVALVTGAARGQGRSHAVRLAEEGADVIAVDVCRQIPSVPFPMATADDLAETARLVEQLGARVVTQVADVRDLEALRRVCDAGAAALGGIDIVCANAGIVSHAPFAAMDVQMWTDVIDVNLTGVFNTVKAALPYLILAGPRGSVVITGSGAALRGSAGIAHYTAAKAGVLGLGRSLAAELGPHRVRVNVVVPGNVDTDMIANDSTYRLFRPDLEQPAREDVTARFAAMQVLPVPWVEPVDVSNAVLFLASDEARYITGVALPVDGGALLR
jgi:SDR family mycofactocin-dependent oxidoreductase